MTVTWWLLLDHSHKVTAQLDAGVDREAETVAGIEAHNFLRSLHGVQNLTRNETLDHEAQQRFPTYFHVITCKL